MAMMEGQLLLKPLISRGLMVRCFPPRADLLSFDALKSHKMSLNLSSILVINCNYTCAWPSDSQPAELLEPHLLVLHFGYLMDSRLSSHRLKD